MKPVGVVVVIATVENVRLSHFSPWFIFVVLMLLMLFVYLFIFLFIAVFIDIIYSFCLLICWLLHSSLSLLVLILSICL